MEITVFGVAKRPQSRYRCEFSRPLRSNFDTNASKKSLQAVYFGHCKWTSSSVCQLGHKSAKWQTSLDEKTIDSLLQCGNNCVVLPTFSTEYFQWLLYTLSTERQFSIVILSKKKFLEFRLRNCFDIQHFAKVRHKKKY